MREQGEGSREDSEKDRKLQIDKLQFEKEKHEKQFQLQQTEVENQAKAVSALMAQVDVSREKNKQEFILQLIQSGKSVQEAKAIYNEINNDGP